MDTLLYLKIQVLYKVGTSTSNAPWQMRAIGNVIVWSRSGFLNEVFAQKKPLGIILTSIFF